MKFFLVTVVLCLYLQVEAEPPVNRYLPPSQSGNYKTTNADSFAPPSQNYGAPQRQTQAFVRQPSSNYGAPSGNSQPQSTYGAPFRGNFAAPSQTYGAPQRQSSSPSTQYGAPNQASSSPSRQYGAPPQKSQFRNSAPSQQYGAPSNQYLPANENSGYARNGGYDDEANNEPANYNFEYMVKDGASGNDFGHREARQDNRAEGVYYVVLPDGRKQTVEYEADEAGYRPKISYEDTGLGANGGYGRGAGGYDDNSQGPY